jgi:hypothetical protein
MKCKYHSECGGEVPPDLTAYGICPACYNGIDDYGVHRYNSAKKANVWANIAHEVNKKNGSFQMNG